MTDNTIILEQKQLKKQRKQKIDIPETAESMDAGFEAMAPTQQQTQGGQHSADYIAEMEVINRLNEKHAILHSDQYYVLTEKPHSLFSGTDFVLESRTSFINTYENQFIIYSDGTSKNIAKLWLTHKDRRQFDGIVFDPTNCHAASKFNIWKGFAITPAKGDCSLFKEHIRDIICSGIPEYFSYIWKWMAHLVQRPQELSPGLVLMGEQGVGKNSVVDALGAIFGQHYLPLDSIDQFLGHFNFHLKNAVLIHGNEAIWGGDKRQLGKLKAMVTERYSVIEEKHCNPITIRNFRHLILSSNEEWPIHLDRDDRRFLALKVSDKRKGDRKYFQALHQELNNGGREALLYELQNVDLFLYDVWDIPQNIESFEVKMASAQSTEQYLYEVLCEGSFDIGNVQPSGAWLSADPYIVPADAVFTDYRVWCEHQGKRPCDERILGKAISRLIKSTDKQRNREYGRKAVYIFPALTKARNEFQQAYKVSNAIWL